MQLLTQLLEEEAIVECILNLNSRGFSPLKGLLQDMANNLHAY
jgi:hypothetical protein